MERFKKFFFQNSNTGQTLVKNTVWLFLSETSGRLLKMGLIIYAARVLGSEGWGIFSYSISIASLLMIFADIGINDLVIREISQKKEGYKTFVSTALLLKIIILVISTLLVIFISPFISYIPQAYNLFAIVAAILFFDSLRELGLSINRASEKMERDMVIKTFTNATIFVLGIILLKTRLAPESVAIAYAIGSAFGFIITMIIIRNEIRNIISNIDLGIFKSIIKITWPFAIITFIVTVMGNIDIYMLGIWRDATEIGLYTSVQRVQQFMIILPSTIGVAVFPLMSRLANTEEEKFKLVVEKALSLVMLVGLPLSVGGILLSNQLVPLIFGQDYLGAIPVMQILMLMLLISFPLVLLSNAIFAKNKQKKLALAYSFGILVNILLNLLLIPKLGAIGASVATLISTTAITIIVWKKLETINNLGVIIKLKKSLLATLIMACSVLIFRYLELNTAINIVISAIIYFLSLLALREPILSDVKEIVGK